MIRRISQSRERTDMNKDIYLLPPHDEDYERECEMVKKYPGMSVAFAFARCAELLLRNIEIETDNYFYYKVVLLREKYHD